MAAAARAEPGIDSQHGTVDCGRRRMGWVKHGGRGHRGWKKLHLAVDRAGVIVAHALTEPTVDDATIGIDLIETRR